MMDLITVIWLAEDRELKGTFYTMPDMIFQPARRMLADTFPVRDVRWDLKNELHEQYT